MCYRTSSCHPACLKSKPCSNTTFASNTYTYSTSTLGDFIHICYI